MVCGDGSIEMSSRVTESSQPVAGGVLGVVPVLERVIDVALVLIASSTQPAVNEHGPGPRLDEVSSSSADPALVGSDQLGISSFLTGRS
jgi:hypothetical protein